MTDPSPSLAELTALWHRPGPEAHASRSTPFLGRLGTVCATLAVTFSLVGGSAWAAQQLSSAARYQHPHRMVAVEGRRRLDLICMGHGTPVVVFLSGLGSSAIDWYKVQPRVGHETEACSYDRAGYGFSDPPDRPSDATNAVADLHALIVAARLPQPVILVAHSLGGLYATLYAETYPRTVAGMLLVDPAFTGQDAGIATAIGRDAAQRVAAAQKQMLASVKRCAVLAEKGELSLPSAATSDCLDNPPDPDLAVHEERNREAQEPSYERALASEFENASIMDADGRTVDDRESARPNASLGALPLVVLTSGNLNMLPGTTEEQSAAAEAVWRAGHDRLAALSSEGRNIVVPNSGHFIQLDHPDAVVEQVHGLLEQVRASGKREGG